jgi:hypothetical protein
LVLDWFWIGFGLVLDWFWFGFGLVLDSFWIGFGLAVMSTIAVWRRLVSAGTDTIGDEYRRLCKTQEAETGVIMGPHEHFEILALIATLVDHSEVLILHNRNVLSMMPCLCFFVSCLSWTSVPITSFDKSNHVMWTTSSSLKAVIESGACPNVSMHSIGGRAFVWWN